VILHWYSGSLPVLERAVAAGCYFSVNPAMLTSAPGREVVTRIPSARLLTETDGPFVRCRGREAEPRDVASVIRAVASMRGVAEEAALRMVYENFAGVLTRDTGVSRSCLDSEAL
jgi:TatD DNase family protein